MAVIGGIEKVGNKVMSETWLSGMDTEEGRRALAEVVLAVFRHWGVETPQQAELLGVEEVTSLWEGAELPNRSNVLERAGLLLAIDRHLKIKYADQPLMQEQWVSAPNIWLRGRSPLEKMLKGVGEIREVLELIEQMTPPEEAPTQH